MLVGQLAVSLSVGFLLAEGVVVTSLFMRNPDALDRPYCSSWEDYKFACYSHIDQCYFYCSFVSLECQNPKEDLPLSQTSHF